MNLLDFAAGRVGDSTAGWKKRLLPKKNQKTTDTTKQNQNTPTQHNTPTKPTTNPRKRLHKKDYHHPPKKKNKKETTTKKTNKQKKKAKPPQKKQKREHPPQTTRPNPHTTQTPPQPTTEKLKTETTRPPRIIACQNLRRNAVAVKSQERLKKGSNKNCGFPALGNGDGPLLRHKTFRSIASGGGAKTDNSGVTRRVVAVSQSLSVYVGGKNRLKLAGYTRQLGR